MDKTIGIIAEYNPFHSGHLYQVQKTKEITGANIVVAAISGNFTQRGTPAIYDKWERAKLATENGVNLVLEIPTVYGCNSAEYFAKGGVETLEALGDIDYLSFGSECGDLDKLMHINYVQREHMEKTTEGIAQGIRNGISYPKAREQAFSKILKADELEILGEPNNILALEYLKQIKTMRPVTIKRNDDGYHQSASQIRKEMKAKDVERISQIENNYYSLVVSTILKSSKKELQAICSCTAGLENKLKQEVRHSKNLEELIHSIKSKAFTYTRISRMLTHILLGITDEDIKTVEYIRVLAFDEVGAKLLKKIKNEEKNTLPIVTNINKEMNKKFVNSQGLAIDILATDIYNLISGKNLYEGSDYVRQPYYLKEQKALGKLK